MPTTTAAMMVYSALASAAVSHQTSQQQQAASSQAGDRAAHRAAQEKAAQEAALKKANAQGEGVTAGGEQSIARGTESQTGSTILTQGQTAKKTNKRKYGQSAAPAAPSATV